MSLRPSYSKIVDKQKLREDFIRDFMANFLATWMACNYHKGLTIDLFSDGPSIEYIRALAQKAWENIHGN